MLRIGTDQQFDEARRVLAAAGFSEPRICAHYSIPSYAKFEFAGKREIPADPPANAFELLVRLFLDEAAVDESWARALFPIDALAALGLIAPHPVESGRIYAPVMLYPTRGVYVVSDRTSPVVSGETISQDIVYPAIVPNTQLFLDLLPHSPCESLADLCAGSGVAALAFSRLATHSWSLDITERSTVFAEFNRRLNAIPNVTALQGDLYAPAGGRAFDRIVAHPPYLPNVGKHWIFDSGGADGEEVLRRLVAGAPDHLKPGGRLYMLAMGTDREQPFEERVRGWLGDRGNQFDVAFVNRRTVDPEGYITTSLARAAAGADAVDEWRGFFRKLGVRAMVYGFTILQRHRTSRVPFTVRRQAGPHSFAAEHEWLMAWETDSISLDPARLMDSRYLAARGTELHVRHRLGDQGWMPESFILETEYPFNTEAHVPAAAGMAIGLADGSLTGRMILEQLIAGGALSAEIKPDEFAGLLKLLVSGGFLEMEARRLPVRSTFQAAG